MVFLLVNTNSAVRKIFNITAKKAGIKLDVVSSISQIPLNEDYNCIFVDDGVLESGNIEQFKSKMITTKFCLILSKDGALVSGFDTYIRKPFLPTDIYEVLKKEKNNDMNFSSNSYNTLESIQSQDDIAVDNSNIDLSEFSDSDDEFLSGVKDTAPSSLGDLNLEEFSPTPTSPLDNNMDINMGDVETIQLDSTPSIDEATPSANDNIDDLALAQAQAEDLSILANNDSSDLASSGDDIDFSSIFELQNEFLQEETKSKKKSLIGGDGYKKKEATPQSTPATPTTPANTPTTPASSPQPEASNMKAESSLESSDFDFNINEATLDSNTLESAPLEIEQNLNINADDKLNFDLDGFDSNNLSNIIEELPSQEPKPQSTSDIINNLDIMQMDSEVDYHTDSASKIVNQVEGGSKNSQYNMLGLPIDDSGDVKDINDLSDDELENLDDEALLLLQEQSLGNLHNENLSSTPEPKVLNKQDISEIATILDSTNNDVSIQNSDFSSLTQEALSEVLGEESMSGAIAMSEGDSMGDSIDGAMMEDIHDGFANMQDDDMLEEAPSEFDEAAMPQEPKIQQNLQSSQVGEQTQINPSNVNIDFTELIKTFPIDKLRELLSGVQITINITFPTKK